MQNIGSLDFINLIFLRRREDGEKQEIRARSNVFTLINPECKRVFNKENDMEEKKKSRSLLG